MGNGSFKSKKRGKVITYEVYVQTGDRLGAGSKVNVKVTLFGEYGNSGERQLLRSRTHRNKFQRGQVDVFAIDSLFLGKLLSIRIGHNETRLGYGWFLDKVYIKEGVDATRSFEFRCNRWLSSRDDDGQIMRDLPLYDVVPASHAEAILPKEHDRDLFYSPGDSHSSQSESEETPREIEPRVHETTRKKSKKKTPTTSKTKSNEKDEIDGFKGTKAENLFDVDDDEEEEEESEDRFFDPDGEYESERSDEEQIVDRKETPRENKVTRFKNVAKATRKEKKREQHSNEEDETEKPKEAKKSDKTPLRFSHVKSAALVSRLSQPTLSAKQSNEESEEKEPESDGQRRDKKKKLANVTAVMRAAKKMPKQEQTQVKETAKEEEKEESESEEEQNEKEEENEQEEQEQSEEEQEEKEEAQPMKAPKGADHLRIITTALSPFLKNRAAAKAKKEPVPPSPIPEEPPELPEQEPEKTEEPEEKTRDSDDDEPAVEFTKEEEKKTSRPSSARSDEYDEGFRAGIRQKQEEERKRHRQSITESESVLKSGQDIHDAAKAGNLARIKELIQAVPSMKSVHNEKGMTPLHVAASNGHLDCVKWLAVSGVDLADETPTGYSAMHLAAMNGHVNCMMILAAMGSAIGCKTVDNFTPLHLAAMSGHIECVKWLLANRAQAEVEDMNGRTALDIAEEYGHEAIQKLLEKFKKELKRQDSTLAQLMKAEKRRKSIDSTTSDNDGAPSKVSDSGVGGMESEEDNWISDTEEDVQAEESKPMENSSNRRASTSSRDRPDSASRSRTDSIATTEDKKKMFEEQRRKMKKRHSSFLDSIRMDVDNPEQDEF